MSNHVTARRNGAWQVVSLAPDVCKTPMGSSTPPIPYPVVAKLADTVSTVRSVKANCDPLVVFDQSKVPSTIGDAAGKAKGIVSGTVEADCWPEDHSSTVRAGGKPMIRHDDLFQMNGTFSGGGSTPKSSKARRWDNRRSQIAAAKDQAVAMPPGAERERLAAATERFERNNVGVEKAKLAQNVYDPNSGAPEGWKNISNDREALKRYRLTEKDLEQPGSKFRAQVYEPDPAVFGPDLKSTVAFKGTSVGEDWKNNLAQGVDMNAPYYEKAVKIGKSVGQSGADVEFAGHSLGGGLASAASRSSGLPATTFNSAGLHANTVSRYGGTPVVPDTENITAYRVASEMLTGVQEQGWKGTMGAAAAGFAVGGAAGAAVGALAKVALSAAAPTALGNKYEVSGQTIGPVRRHFMQQAIDGIESQKKADQAVLSSATGIASE